MIRALFSSLILAASAGSALAQAPAQPAPDAPPTDGGVDGAATGDLSKAADVAAELANTQPAGDDLSKAADATAEVASVPPAAPVPAAPAAKASSDDIDLSALGLDPAAAAFDDKLNIYGFADVGFLAYHFPRPIPPVIPDQDTKTFFLGNLNLYLAKNLTPRVRTLSEIRFTFLPNDTINPDGTFISTQANDATEYSRTVQWGAIIIERAYVEYDLTDHLTIRGGHWLTPYGIWNIDHGSPAIIATLRPYIIGQEFFPEHQTGLDLFGNHTESGFTIGYHLTASNGRGGAEAQSDIDSKLAFGGRLELDTPWGIRLGGSYYRGRYTALETTAGVSPETYLEAAYGGDLQFDHGPLHIQAEAIGHDRHYASGVRALTPAGFKPDGRDVGYYVLAGYRFDHLWSIMPYAYYQDYRPIDPAFFSRIWSIDAGLNFRPSPSMVLKAQVNYASAPPGSAPLDNGATLQFTAQASWVF
ncbi:MAG TPA: hypothetical protein VHW23_18470 [Kofleriaceae bacterium]|jgi:hypothetical protein|nr:hypothetical protein [Kofleriaceae bacterium]